ncbi:MAG TPA: UMP kinase [Candidatus Gracilibacteria bacterium]|nr:UMP kinase [Candidatus Gracilibacteria bacterium]
MIKYKRILLKMSGEVLKGSLNGGVDFETALRFAERIKKLKKLGVEIGIVIGGGNIWRYRDFAANGSNTQDISTDKVVKISKSKFVSTKAKEIDRITSDTLGMMATNMNAMAFESVLKMVGLKAKALTAFPVKGVETYSIAKGKTFLKKGYVVVFGGGTGQPLYTTDSAAAIRAADMKCDVVIKATKVDGVYDKDPTKFKTAKKFETLKYDDVVKKKLSVMDLTCAKILKKAKIPMLVFNLNKEGLIEKAVRGEKIGTLIN